MAQDKNDEYRRLIRQSEAEQKRTADLREAFIAMRYTTLGYRLLCVGDEETRARFHIPEREEAADIVITRAIGQCIIAEVKGTDLSKAIRQLRNTARYVMKEFPKIQPKIFANYSRYSTTPFQSLSGGFQASGQHQEECLLVNACGEIQTLETGETITIVFGY